MEPRITKRERKLILTYDLPSRVRCSAIHPQSAPNGSTIVFHGYNAGLRVLWRGGRRLRRQPAHHNGSSSMEVDGLDSMQESEIDPGDYEDEEEELDTDCPHPSILYTMQLNLESSVSKIAIPTSASSQQENATIVVATIDGDILLLRIPLAPSQGNKAKRVASSIVRESIQLKQGSGYVRSLAAKVVNDYAGIIVAAASDQLELWQISADATQMEEPLHTVIPSTGMLVGLSFHPSPRSRHLAIVNKFGSVGVYEVADISKAQAGRWLYTLCTPFEAQSDTSPSRPGRKRVLDAKFILDGRCIFAILDDGQWGVWDTTASQLDQFVLSGYLESAVPVDTTEPAVAKRSTSALTPMTPNTRKVKSLFSTAQARVAGSAAHGGISVSRSPNAAVVIDESVMIWHNDDIYSVPSAQSFWQRSTSDSSSLGTLHAPGIARMQSTRLFNETITSISQFAAGSPASGIGQLKTQRDFLVSAENRLFIVQSRATAPSHAPVDMTDTRDQRKLDAGELDLGGMDRILNNMSGLTRKVGFAN